MNIVLHEGPWPAKGGRKALNYRVEADGEVYLCRITDLALYDDYREPYEDNPMEHVFQKHIEDVLRRTAQLLPGDVNAKDGEPAVIVMSGHGMPG